jgi:hypothetical protein
MTALLPQKAHSKRYRNAAIGGAVLSFFLFLLWIKVFYSSMQDYKSGESLLKENQTIRAITYFDRSLHWYAPLNPYGERSAKKLWEIGERAVKEGDLRMARIAFESIRNACYGTSHLFNPCGEWIEKAESRITTLESEGAHGQEGLAVGTPKKSPRPHAGWSVAAVVGFLAWVGSAIGFIISVFRKDRGTPRTFRKCLAWLSLILAFAALWVAGMVMA